MEIQIANREAETVATHSSSVVAIREPSTVKLPIHASDISAMRVNGSDLVIVLNSGEEIVLEGFYSEAAVGSEVLLQDGAAVELPVVGGLSDSSLLGGLGLAALAVAVGSGGSGSEGVGNKAEAALAKIAAYADDNGKEAPTVSDYEAAGVTGVTEGNLADVNAAIDAVAGTDADTTPEIQALVDSKIAQIALAKISAYADDNSNEAPTVSDYEDAGVTGVTEGNLADVNAAIDAVAGTDADTTPEIQDKIDVVVTVQFVAGPVVADHGLMARLYDGSGNPLTSEFKLNSDGTYAQNIGPYSGVVCVHVWDVTDTADFMDEATKEGKDIGSDYRALSVVDTPGEHRINVTPLTEAVASSLAPNTPTSDVWNFGGVGEDEVVFARDKVLEAVGLSEEEWNSEIVASVNQDGSVNLNVNDYGKILAAFSGLEDGLQIATSKLIFDFVDNVFNAEGLSVDTRAQLVMGARNAGVEDYEGVAGLVKLSQSTLDAIKGLELVELEVAIEVLDEAGNDSGDEIDDDTVVAILNFAKSFTVIVNYANDSTNPTPTLNDYDNVGVIGVNGSNLEHVNAAIDEADWTDVLDPKGIQFTITPAIALAKISAYADDNGNDVPTVEDYEDAGVTGVTADNLADANAAIDAVVGTDADTSSEIQVLVDKPIALAKISAYADDNSNEAPTVSDYEDAGVTGVTADNLAAANAAIDAVAGADADTTAEIQDILTGVLALAKIVAYANDDTNPEPTADDYYYATPDWYDVDSEIIGDINALVASRSGADVDTPEKVRSCISDLFLGYMEEYRASDGQTGLMAQWEADGYISYIYEGISEDIIVKRGSNAAAVKWHLLNAEASEIDTAAEVAFLVQQADAAIAKVEAFSISGGSGPLTVQDYLEAGAEGVTEGNLAGMNYVFGNLPAGASDTSPEIQSAVDLVLASFDKIAAFADFSEFGDYDERMLAVEDFLRTGADFSSFETRTGEQQYNFLTQIASRVGTDVDTTAEIQAIIDNGLPDDEIDLSHSMGGKLIKPLQMLIDGDVRTFYVWDMNGDGMITKAGDSVDLDVYLAEFQTNTGSPLSEDIASRTIDAGNGIQLRIPTLGSEPTGRVIEHTSTVDGGWMDQKTYDDMHAYFDALNGNAIADSNDILSFLTATKDSENDYYYTAFLGGGGGWGLVSDIDTSSPGHNKYGIGLVFEVI